MTTTTYRVTGKLTTPVNNLQDARDFLRERGEEMELYIYPIYLQEAVHTVRWDLVNDDTWEVIVVTHYAMTPEECELLSAWIQGQNSDGLGEGFEQQPFAEHPDEDTEDGYETVMSSFDWETNPCELVVIK